MENIMNVNTTKHRWLTGITGAIAIILGFWSWSAPIAAVATMTWVFGILMLVAGIASIVAWKDMKDDIERPTGLMVSGIFSIVIAAILMFTHMTSFVMLATLFAVWFIVNSCTAFSFADLSHYPTWARIASVIGVVFGVILLFAPLLSLAALLITVSVTLIAYGIMAIVNAL